MSETKQEVKAPLTLEQINEAIQLLPDGDKGKVSDGYHRFDELYDHRIGNYIALCKRIALRTKNMTNPVWRTWNHSDGKPAFGGGWFVLGIFDKAGDQITYHLPENMWEICQFARAIPQAPEFDGHTSADVLERLSAL